MWKAVALAEMLMTGTVTAGLASAAAAVGARSAAELSLPTTALYFSIS